MAAAEVVTVDGTATGLKAALALAAIQVMVPILAILQEPQHLQVLVLVLLLAITQVHMVCQQVVVLVYMGEVQTARLEVNFSAVAAVLAALMVQVEKLLEKADLKQSAVVDTVAVVADLELVMEEVREDLAQLG
jgi:hypothetical protein